VGDDVPFGAAHHVATLAAAIDAARDRAVAVHTAEDRSRDQAHRGGLHPAREE
jgi:hypothetical protein